MALRSQIGDDELILVATKLDDLAVWFGELPDAAPGTVAQIPHSKYPSTRTIVDDLRHLGGLDWSTVEYGQLSLLSRSKHVGKPMKIRGSIRMMSSVWPCYSLPGNPVDELEIEIADNYGESIQTIPIADATLLDKVQAFFGTYQSFDFFGTIIPQSPKTDKSKKPIFKFFLYDIESSDDPLQMIQATSQEIEACKDLVTNLSAQSGDILNYIRTKLIEIIGIKGLEDAPELNRSLSFMIFQAISDGYDARRSLSHKLHSLVIGSPAVGKKLLCEAAYILNPVYTEGHPGKITVAGIAGRAIKRDGEWTSDPGLIPLAHRGTFAVQDFHHVKRKSEIMGVLSMVMEDGKVIDSTAANKEHHALTSIHIDMNKTSHIKLANPSDDDSAQSRLADLGLSMNVITRFDYIVDIPRDTMRQMEIALQMQSGSQKTVRHRGKRAHSTEARLLQVLIAYLRTAYDEIEIPGALTEGYIRGKQEELLTINQQFLAENQLLGDYQTRLSNSIHKLIFSIARANARATATAADADEAFRFVHTKLDFLSTIESFQVPTSWDDTPVSDKIRKRRAFIRTEFAGQEVSVEDVHALVCEKCDQQVSATTIRRDLREIGLSVKHGSFRIVGADDGEMAK